MKTKFKIFAVAMMMMAGAITSNVRAQSGWSVDVDSLMTLMQKALLGEETLSPSEFDHYCWLLACELDVHESYAAYCYLFPGGDSVEVGKDIMKTMEEQAWRKARASKNWKGVWDFIVTYQYGYYHDQAVALIESLIETPTLNLDTLFAEDGLCAADDSGIVFISNIDNSGDKIAFTFSNPKTGRTVASSVLSPGQYRKLKLRNGRYNVLISGMENEIPRHGQMDVQNKVYSLCYFTYPLNITIRMSREELERRYADATIIERHMLIRQKIVCTELLKMIAQSLKGQTAQTFMNITVYERRSMLTVEMLLAQMFESGMDGIDVQQAKEVIRQMYLATPDLYPMLEALQCSGFGLEYRYVMSDRTMTVAFTKSEVATLKAEMERLYEGE